VKRIISVTILILLLYLVYKTAINLFFNEYDYSYSLKKEDVTIRINQKTKLTDEKEKFYTCYLQLIYNNKHFNTKYITENEGKEEKVKDFIFYSNDNYMCIYPVVKEENKTDVICNIDGKEKEYSSIKNKYKEIDSFVEKLKKQGYSYHAWNE